MRFFKNMRPIAVCLLLCALLSACTAPALQYANAEPTPGTSAPAATPTAAPVDPPASTPASEHAITAAELCELCCAEFRYYFEPDFSAHDYSSTGMLDMPGLIAKHSTYVQLCDELAALADACAQAALIKCKQLSADIAEIEVKLTSYLDWRLMAAACVALDAPAQQIAQCASVNAVFDKGTLKLFILLPDFDTLFAQSSSAEFHTALSLFSYLNTTYDDDGELTENTGEYELSSEYIATIMDPLPKRHIKNGWYGDRSKATRRHMGTDIRANEWQDIPACTAGTVMRIGYDPISGNYVTIKDDYGFYYSYCHMVELTTFLIEGQRVEQGQLIGHIGNTGNSDAPHLHLAIIAPEYIYINPYPVLARVRYGD